MLRERVNREGGAEQRGAGGSLCWGLRGRDEAGDPLGEDGQRKRGDTAPGAPTPPAPPSREKTARRLWRARLRPPSPRVGPAFRRRDGAERPGAVRRTGPTSSGSSSRWRLGLV